MVLRTQIAKFLISPVPTESKFFFQFLCLPNFPCTWYIILIGAQWSLSEDRSDICEGQGDQQWTMEEYLR